MSGGFRIVSDTLVKYWKQSHWLTVQSVKTVQMPNFKWTPTSQILFQIFLNCD